MESEERRGSGRREEKTNIGAVGVTVCDFERERERRDKINELKPSF